MPDKAIINGMGECAYGIRIRCKECKVKVTIRHIIGERLQCPACDSYNVEELFTHIYSSDGELVDKISAVLVPIKSL